MTDYLYANGDVSRFGPLYPYTQPRYDSFGWTPLSRSSLDPAESHGLDYESAREATPRWYGVSFGDGNNGVSQTFPNYYCRTADPWLLARAAMVGNFYPDSDRQWAIENMEVDGEADYTISATILDPPEEDLDEGENDETESWSSFNGAWLICEVFPVDSGDMRDSAPEYESIAECFTADLLALVESNQ